MSANPIYTYPTASRTISDFEKKGYPGKWNRVVAVSNTTTDFTGSNFGASAFLITAAANATASMAAGGTLDLGLLTADTLYEIPVSQVISADTNVIYVFIENVNVEGNHRGIY
jgi:hypothetical protein